VPPSYLGEQIAHCVMVLPNVNDHDQYFIPKTNSLGGKIKESLGIFYFPKLNIQN